MFNKNIKLVLAAAIIAYGIYQIIETYVGNGIMLILLSLIFVFLYFKNEMILSIASFRCSGESSFSQGC